MGLIFEGKKAKFAEGDSKVVKYQNESELSEIEKVINLQIESLKFLKENN